MTQCDNTGSHNKQLNNDNKINLNMVHGLATRARVPLSPSFPSWVYLLPRVILMRNEHSRSQSLGESRSSAPEPTAPRHGSNIDIQSANAENATERPSSQAYNASAKRDLPPIKLADDDDSIAGVWCIDVLRAVCFLLLDKMYLVLCLK